MDKLVMEQLKKSVNDGDRWQISFWLLVGILLVGVTWVLKEHKNVRKFFNDVQEYQKFVNKLKKAEGNLQNLVNGVERSMKNIENNRVNFNKIAENTKFQASQVRSNGNTIVRKNVSQLQEIYDLSIQDMQNAVNEVRENLQEAEYLSINHSKIIADAVAKHGKRTKK